MSTYTNLSTCPLELLYLLGFVSSRYFRPPSTFPESSPTKKKPPIPEWASTSKLSALVTDPPAPRVARRWRATTPWRWPTARRSTRLATAASPSSSPLAVERFVFAWLSSLASSSRLYWCSLGVVGLDETPYQALGTSRLPGVRLIIDF